MRGCCRRAVGRAMSARCVAGSASLRAARFLDTRTRLTPAVSFPPDLLIGPNSCDDTFAVRSVVAARLRFVALAAAAHMAACLGVIDRELVRFGGLAAEVAAHHDPSPP